VARLYFDHNVSLHLVPALRNQGRDMSVARDLQQTRLTDDAQLLAAVRDSRALVTHDREDFTLLHDAWTNWPAAFGVTFPPHAGIIVLDPARHEVLLGALGDFLLSITTQALVSQFFWWHHREGWRRRVVGHRWEPVENRRNW
jgi:Domain of unknown function (DUF5615)